MNADYVASVQKSCRDIHAVTEDLRRKIVDADRGLKICNSGEPTAGGGLEWEQLLACRARLREIERHLAPAGHLAMKLYFECLAEEKPAE